MRHEVYRDSTNYTVPGTHKGVLWDFYYFLSFLWDFFIQASIVFFTKAADSAT